MYRCSLPLLFRETRTVLTTPKQVFGCRILSSPAGSQRNFTNSDNVVKLKNGKENQENGSSEQAFKMKKLNMIVDNLYEENTKVSIDVGKKSGESANKLKRNSKVNKEPKKKEASEEVKNGKGDTFQTKTKVATSQMPILKSIDFTYLYSDKEKQDEGLYGDKKKVPADLDKESVKSQIEEIEVSAETECSTRIEMSSSLEKRVPYEKQEEELETDITEGLNGIKVLKEDSSKGKSKEMKTEEQKHVRVDETSSIDHDIDYGTIRDRIYSMDSPQDILEYLENFYVNKQLSEGHSLTIFSDALKRLESLEPVPISPIIANYVFEVLEKRSLISRIPFVFLSRMTKYLIETSSLDDNLTETLLHEISWRLRTLPIKATLDTVQMMKLRQTTAKRREVHKLATEKSKEIIQTVSRPSEVISLLHCLGQTDAKQRVEQEALAMLHTMDCSETCKLLNALVKNRSANYTLIQEALQHLFSRPISLGYGQFLNLFYICAHLKVKDPKKLEEISVNFLECLQNNSPLNKSNNLIAVLHSCSVLGWNYKPLTCKIIEELINDEKLFDNQNEKALKDILLSLSFLNLENFKGFGRKIASHLMSNCKITKYFHLDVVNSLAYLNIAEKDEVLEVLQPSFYQPVLDSLNDKPKFLQQNVKFKLMGLYGYLKEDLKETSVDVDKTVIKWIDELQAEMETEPLSNFGKSVSEIVTSVAPLHKYAKLNVVNRYGYIIDFELFVDEHKKAVKLKDANGMQRVWIKLLHENAFVNEGGDINPSGKTVMMMRHLQNEKDTVVVFVNSYEWKNLVLKSDHLQHLESLIKTAVDKHRQSKWSNDGESTEREIVLEEKI